MGRVQERAKRPDALARRIMFGLGIGIVLGLAARALMAIGPGWESSIRWFNREALEPFGQVFLRMLFFVVVPLVFSSLALGVVQLRRLDRLGPLAGRTFAMFGLNMAVGVGLGLLMMNVLSPGTRIEPETRDQLLGQYSGAIETIATRAAEQESLSFRKLVEMFMPRNLVKSVVEFQLLPLILFALLVGAAGTRLAEEHREGMAAVLQVVMEVMTEIVHYALKLAPYGVAALVGSVVIVAGAEVLRPLLWFVVGVTGVLALHLFGSMSLFLKLFSRRSPRVFFRAVRSVLITAFSTSSSSATLPTSIQVSQEVLKVSPSTAGFVLPLGATMNMSGTALYEGCVVLFVAQVYGVELSIGSQLTLLVLAVLSAVAVAGIPGASLPVLVGLLASFNLPAEGIALILGFDRLLDMGRTAVNVGADLVTACVVDERMGDGGERSDSESAV
ncbi:MAG: dicarboxylate/amino acid:cation symporter [Verrucomicrobia bacterium]|nr:dicarboxylate/amino acid:cation symporter [Verrucomicrobiota bacterium]